MGSRRKNNLTAQFCISELGTNVYGVLSAGTIGVHEL
jgi:hypothetical protein